MEKTNKEEREIVAEYICSKLARSKHLKVGQVTAILGVVEKRFEKEYFNLYSRVNLALYQAK